MSAVVSHPRVVELIERAKLRKSVARAVTRLIAILDELDGDPEAEPWLGASVVLYPAHDDQRSWARACNDDREQDAGEERELEDEHGDLADWEPSLGAAEGREDQRRWAAGGRQDLEAQDHV